MAADLCGTQQKRLRRSPALYLQRRSIKAEQGKELMNELSITENLIAEYRSNFNKQVKEYNRYVRQFPARLFLNILGYETQTYDYLNYNAPVDAPQNLFGD